MPTLFDADTLKDVLNRIRRLDGATVPLWGRMNAAQMCAHVAKAMEIAVGDRIVSHSLIGRLLGRLVKKKWLGDESFQKDGPTSPDLKVLDDRNFDRERARLTTLIERFGAAGPAGATKGPHAFFGRLEPDEWGRLIWKHADHHLRQFGV